MKHLNLLLTLILFMAVATTLAQAPDKTITVNFKDLQKKYEETIKNKQTFVVQVTNINRSLYKIDGVMTETNYNTALPTALTGIKLPSFFYTTSPNKTDGAAAPSKSDLLESIKAGMDKIKRDARDLDNATLLYNELLHLQKNCADTQQTIIDKAMKKVNAYLHDNDEDYGNKTSDQLRVELQTYLLGLRKSADSTATQIQRDLVKYETDEAKKIAEQRDSDLKKLNKGSSDYQKRVKDIEAIYQDDMKAFAVIVTDLKINMDKAFATIEDMRKFEKDDKIYALVKLFNLVYNASSFTYTSEVITAHTDEIKYIITIEPTELNTCDNAKKIIEIKVKVENGFKMDFSTGLFVNSGNANFLGQSYYYINTDDTHRQILTADRGSRALVSVGALMHFYKRSLSAVKLGGSLGVSTTAAVTDLLFHAGPSLFIGSENRVVISGGLTLKSSSLLDQKLQTNTIYTKLQSPDAIPTVSVFPRAGYFISLTYNFTALKASK